MTQQSTKKEYNSFIQGIITEAGPLTFPENASLDEANCVLNRDGSRQRRLGMDFEDDFVLRNVTVLPDDAVASFRWYNVANDTDIQFAVIQVGKRLLVFDAKNSPAISAKLVANLDISSYATGKTVVGTASGMGYFFVTAGVDTPFYLSYNPATKVVGLTTYQIRIRDVFGVDDGLSVDNQPPGASSTAHRYNLLNQGWTDALIAQYLGSQSKSPSNAQQWFIGKDSNDDFQPALLAKQDFGTTPAPRGRYIIDAFARSTSRFERSGVAVAADLETGYPSVVGFAFERVWYAGMQSKYNGANEFNPNYTGFVFYSRTLRGTKDFGQCYSDADPTSEHDSELVETDGGFVNIPEAGQIYKLVQKGASMVVFAEHGIWEISGGESGFTGVSHKVVKVSDFGVLSASSVVDAEQVLLYWNRGGIYLLAPNEVGILTSTNISEKTIQTLYNTLDRRVKKNAVGTFDPINRRVSWMYNDSTSYNGTTYRHKYNKELVLDLVLSAFYKNTISSYLTDSPYIAGYVETPDFLLREEGIRTRGDSVTKYLTVQYLDVPTNAASITFSYYRDPTFRDWKSSDGLGTSFSSYLITGYEVMGDSARVKGSPYLIMHFKQTETETVEIAGEIYANNPSGCLVQAQWDWSNHMDSGKWGEEFQAYRLNRPIIFPETGGQPITYGHEVVTTKNRLRGSGRSLSLYIHSDGDKDFYLYGWATRFYGKAYV